MMAMSGSELEDFSSSSTVITFDHPLPLLRGPIPASPSDDPSIGPFVLSFKDDRNWRLAYRATESKIIEQCEAGVRIGCAISASAKCKPPWWKTLFGANTMDLNEREQCEEREMAACLAASKESCIQFAREKCLPAFRDARIAMADQKGIPKRMFRGSPYSDSDPTSAANSSESNPDRVVTNYRGSVLLGSGSNPKDSKN